MTDNTHFLFCIVLCVLYWPLSLIQQSSVVFGCERWISYQNTKRLVLRPLVKGRDTINTVAFNTVEYSPEDSLFIHIPHFKSLIHQLLKPKHNLSTNTPTLSFCSHRNNRYDRKTFTSLSYEATTTASHTHACALVVSQCLVSSLVCRELVSMMGGDLVGCTLSVSSKWV